MKNSLNKFPLVVLLAFMLSACNLGMQPTADAAATLDPLYTVAAQTLEAMNTQAVTTTGSAPATSTPSPGDNPTATPTSTLFIVTSTVFSSPVPV